MKNVQWDKLLCAHTNLILKSPEGGTFTTFTVAAHLILLYDTAAAYDHSNYSYNVHDIAVKYASFCVKLNCWVMKWPTLPNS